MNEEPKINGENRMQDPTTGKFIKGNPGGGRPKGSISVVDAIKAKLQECPEGKEKTYLHYLVEKVMKKAIIDDDVAMIKDIINRVDGMPKQSTDITTNGKDLFPDEQSRAKSKEAVNEFLNVNTGDITRS